MIRWRVWAEIRRLLWGAILRFQVDKDDLIPADNPFVKEEGANPYIWVYGLRNPWRFSFLPDGNLIIADVGTG